MKIAVLQSEGRLFPQCEHTGQVAIVEVDPVSHSVQQTTFLTPPSQPVGALADWLCREEIEVLLTSGMGRQDLELLQQRGVEVVVGVPAFRIEPVIASFLAGTLQTGANPCEQLTGGCR
jgi:predicted Fe-Mo cluster-binding NifX family protein